jgi:hypothetical protein
MTYQKKNNRPPRPGEGRPTSYRPEYCDEIIEYFDVPFSEQKLVGKVTGKNNYTKEEYKEVGCPMRFLSGFARHIKVDTSTLFEWCNKHPEFSKAFTRAKELQAEMLHSNSLKGLYDARYAVFSAKNMTEWRDKVDIDHGIQDETFEKYQTMSIGELRKKLNDILPGNRISNIIPSTAG